MEKQNVSVFGKLILIAVVSSLFIPLVARAEQDADDRIEQLEQQLKIVEKELAALKAEKAKETEKSSSGVDEKQVEKIVDKILAEQPQLEQGSNDFRFFWKEGLGFETPNKDFQFKVGGRLMYDFGWISEDDDLKTDLGDDQHDSSETRRARLYFSGLLYDNIDFKLQFDFAGGDADLKDAYLGLRDFGFGKIRAGHFKEPFGLEELTSSKYITFMERALPIEAFAPSRNAGVMFYNAAFDERMTWAAGIFRNTDDYGDDKDEDDGGYSATARLTALPIYEDKGASLLHFGVSYSSRDTAHNSTLGRDATRFRSRPEAHTFDRFVDTGNFASDHMDLYGFEGAWVSGPLSIQSEYIFADADASSDVNFNGYYAQVSYFLTGEHRNYKPSSGLFSRVKPNKNFGAEGGLGAWEVAARYSSLDLDDGSISGGKLDDISVGLNWHLNPNTRLMWNYIHADKDNIGEADMFLTRLQIDF